MTPPDRPQERTSFDRLIKAALREDYLDLAAWLTGTRPVQVEAIETCLAATAERFTDKLLVLRFLERPPTVLHVEFLAQGSREVPGRATVYLALILGVLTRPDLRGAKLACVVVYLSRKGYVEDPGRLEYQGDLGLHLKLSYRVVRLWEEDPAPVLALGSPGLCPFVPLMRGNPAELLLQSQARIASAPETLVTSERKKELLAVLAGLASRVIEDKDLLARLVSEIRAMGENFVFDLLREEGEAVGLIKGRQEGREEGREDEARRIILQILQRRFGSGSGSLERSLSALKDISVLESLVVQAALCENLKTFLEQSGLGPGTR